MVAGFLFALLSLVLRRVRGSARAAQLGAAAGVWLYVLLMGAPDAAVRAALMLSLLAASQWGGRQLSAEGALAAAYLGMTALDPGAPGRIGFQLSFA